MLQFAVENCIVKYLFGTVRIFNVEIMLCNADIGNKTV